MIDKRKATIQGSFADLESAAKKNMMKLDWVLGKIQNRFRNGHNNALRKDTTTIRSVSGGGECFGDLGISRSRDRQPLGGQIEKSSVTCNAKTAFP